MNKKLKKNLIFATCISALLSLQVIYRLLIKGLLILALKSDTSLLLLYLLALILTLKFRLERILGIPITFFRFQFLRGSLPIFKIE